MRIYVQLIVCDAPARAYILQTKGHSGFYACTFCVARGKHDGEMVFPDVGLPRQTDRDFRLETYPGHHLPMAMSPLGKLNIDIVESFVVDYLHCCLLGITKTLLRLLRKGWKHRSFLLTLSQRNRLDDEMNALRSGTPSDFQRRCRPFTESDKWKAT